MADPSDEALLKAIERLSNTFEESVNSEKTTMQKYIESLEVISNKLDAIAGESDLNRRAGEDGRRSSNAYTNAYRGSGTNRRYMNRPEEQRNKGFMRWLEGVTDEKDRDGNYIGNYATGMFNPRRSVGRLNLPEVAALAKEGHLEQAGGMFVTGLARSPYAQPFAIGAELRGLAKGADFARNRVMAQRLGQPTTMGMATGAMGPGAESFGSGVGSFVSSLTAFPSMFMNKTGDPMGLFGTSMSPAAREGYQMQKKAFVDSLNPFQMMGYQQNLEIIKATSAKGFKSQGQSFQVSDAVKDLVQSIGIDTGQAIDFLDVAIKRLHMDIGDAQEQMKLFGTMSKGAGKGVAEFAKETFEVMSSMSKQNAVGPGAMSASALMSSVPQVTGQGVFNFMNSPTMTGLTMATAAGQGMGMQDMFKMSMGAPFATEGGVGENKMVAQSMETYKKYVDMFKKSGMDESTAIVYAGQVFGLDPLAAKQLYKNAPRMIATAKVSQDLDKLKGLSYGKYGSGAASRAIFGTGKTTPEGMQARNKANDAFKILQSQFKAGKGAAEATGGRGKGSGLGMGGVLGGAVKFEDPSGNDNMQFNIDVNSLADAKRFRPNDVEGIRQEIIERGGDIDTVERAANLLIGAGKGGKGAYENLLKEFNVQIGGNAMTGDKGFNSNTFLREQSSFKYMNAGEKQSYIATGKSALNEALKGKLIKQKEYDKYLKAVETGKFNIDQFQSKIIGKSAQQDSVTQNGVTVALADEAKGLLKLIPGRPGSNNGGSGAPRNENP
jgi:hypothetical protein